MSEKLQISISFRDRRLGRCCKTRKNGYKWGVKNVSLDLLKTFVTYADSENMSQAAGRLNLSQPAITFQLKKLQECLDHPLFVQVGAKKQLTPFGREMYDNLKVRFEQFDTTISKIEGYHSDPEHRVYKIAGRREIISRLLPKMDFVGTLEIQNMNEDEAKESLFRNEIDIAILFEKLHRNNIVQERLFSDHAILCVHKSLVADLLDKNGDLSLAIARGRKFLFDTPVITYNRDFPYFRRWLEHNRLDVQDLNVKCFYEDWNTLVSLVEQGIGFSIVPSEIRIDSEDIIKIDIPPQAVEPATVYAAYHQELNDLGVVQKIFRFD